MKKTLNHFAYILITLLLTSLANAQTLDTPDAPSLAASSYILMDFHSENILAEKDINKQVDPASITKMMTAYVVFSELKNGRLSKSDKVTVSEKAWRTGGSKMFIEVNKQVLVVHFNKHL